MIDWIDDEIGDFDDFGFLDGIAAGDGSEPGVKFGEGEGLDEVVIGSGVESGDSIFDGVAGGEHEDGGCIAHVAEGLADLDPVFDWDHEIEDDGSVAVFDGEIEGGFSIAGDIDCVPSFAESAF